MVTEKETTFFLVVSGIRVKMSNLSNHTHYSKISDQLKTMTLCYWH